MQKKKKKNLAFPALSSSTWHWPETSRLCPGYHARGTYSTLLLLSEVTGEARPYHGKEAVDPRQGRARSDPTHFHAVNVAQPVRFSSKLQTCPNHAAH
jgi:hypothetical protein